MMNTITIKLNDDFAFLLDKNQPAIFNYFMQLDGDIYRKQPGRATLKFSLHGKTYFIKKHFGVGWREIFKNLIFLRKPVTGAANEWQALEYLASLGLNVATVQAYGKRGMNPATQQSFVVMTAVEDSISLADFCQNWVHKPPSYNLKRRLIATVAHIARIMHSHGVNHRDFYICHFLLKKGSENDNPTIFIIDLHRAMINKNVPYRWLVKDLAGLYFSAMDIGLSKSDIIYFLQLYFMLPWREIIKRHNKLLKTIEQKSHQLYYKEFSRLSPMPHYFKDESCS